MCLIWKARSANANRTDIFTMIGFTLVHWHWLEQHGFGTTGKGKTNKVKGNGHNLDL